MPRKKKLALPPDPEQLNNDRSKWAMAAVETFMRETGLGKADGLETAVMDLVADLAHLCDRHELDFHALCDRAASHYNEETNSVGTQLDFARDWS